MIKRRTFIQVLSAGLASLKSFAGSTQEKVTGNPYGWTITWLDAGEGETRGSWLAVPQTPDRDIAFRSVVSEANPKKRARERVIAMIQESRNGSKLLQLQVKKNNTPQNIDEITWNCLSPAMRRLLGKGDRD